MANYFRKLEPSKTEYHLTVYKSTYAYHTLHHNHSFRSIDCTTSLQKKFADKKFSCARTKCESTVTNVYGPWALEKLKNDLYCANFVTVSHDPSNHKHVKQLPILVQYFQACDLENSAKNKLLTFVEISRETADIAPMQVMKAIANYDLGTKVVGLSAHNTNTNFGGLLGRGKNMC
jgi:hypothetical protein